MRLCSFWRLDGRITGLVFPASRGCPPLLGSEPCVVLPSHLPLGLCLSRLLLIRTLAQPDDAGPSFHLKTLNLITSAESLLLPCKATRSQVPGSGCGHLWGGAVIQGGTVGLRSLCSEL